jgi:EpsI family protein
MTTSRLAQLLALMLGGMSMIFVLPKVHENDPAGIRLELPESLGEWSGKDVAISEKEINVLGPETRFARKDYENAFGDRIHVSIVLAGPDMMTSIHRPERCLEAQGWQLTPGDESLIDVPGRGKVPITQLHMSRMARVGDGQPFRLDNICDYWFAGRNELTASHWSRVWIDARDRIMHHFMQRWAMILVSSEITAGHEKFGRDEAQTDAMLKKFIGQLAPLIHEDSVKYR